MAKEKDEWIVIKGKKANDNFSGTAKSAGDLFRDNICNRNFTEDTLKINIDLLDSNDGNSCQEPTYPITKIETAGDLFRTPKELYNKR